MFVIQNYFRNRKAKIRAWEEARDKWVNEDTGLYSHRSNERYAINHPMPVADLGFITRLVLLIFAGIVGVTLFGLFVYNEVTEPPKPPEKKAEVVKVANGEKCGEFKQNDHVIIQYGDYARLQGNIIGGCGQNEDYQVKLDPDQKADISRDNNEDEVEVGNNIISVNSTSNIVVINSEKK